MSNRLNCEAPPQPKARAARETVVSSCANCTTATQPRAPDPIPVLVPVAVVPVPIPVPVLVPDRISPRKEELNSLSGVLHNARPTRAPVRVLSTFFTIF